MAIRTRANVTSFLPPGGEPSITPNPSVESAIQPAFTSPLSALDRLGGIDGIMSIMGKIQRMFGMFQQMRPAFNMISSFMGPKAAIKSIPNKGSGIKKEASTQRAKVHKAAIRKQARKSGTR
ncbi:hypothetical protein Back11_09290 [Paenibacillus baekrokdamisoli]|uniref:Uncharacterized protein n=1 Tax=Paenibacillus baekrokdamisoli TaxID=1712516 RepID=A0A3G9J8I2_9BACL|nr:hypothetical protein [Paenibacillus baekrokdamisoli]MBB3067225.1 hypothetical protein [Paenibacillus baekrokdamisoli]BBH19584.1 hypothetical protein Back11_09290 [Paenibacillus baekrokdamisoli]